MSDLISSETMYEFMEWAYDKSVNGIGLGSATEMTEDYLSENGSLEDRINSLIRWQNTKAGAAGFTTGLGGLMTLPLALPANIASTIYVQIRMVATIAYMAGYDIKHDRVKTMIYMCLLGNSVGEIAKDFGVTVGTKFTKAFIEKKLVGSCSKKSIKQLVFAW